MVVEIDKNAGFCFGVVKAIEKAEGVLNKKEKLYCLGEIVHNQLEVGRLETMGMQTIDYNTFKGLKDCTVLIRAHGEPPETYQFAKQNNITLVDATCPVVIKLQQKVKIASEHPLQEQGQVLIYGKKGHAEVLGLNGQVKGRAIVISDFDDLNKVDYSKPISLFSQTTMSTNGFKEIEEEISRRKNVSSYPSADFKSKNSICGHVTKREPSLTIFAKQNDVVIFVSGKNSSNGKMLFNISKSINPKSHFIQDKTELKKEWLLNANKIGITGATSTPLWLMEEVKNLIENQIL